MARLNDPPMPPIESLDSLKRRFIRQNREIARVNSTQSQRIRNLETEISRLLAENIALREQGIAAAAEAERWRTASRIGKDVTELKSRLQVKLSEVNVLIEELGGIPEKASRRSSIRRGKSGVSHDTIASPRERNLHRLSHGALPTDERNGQDGRLPAILEDKYYPRRTLEQEELRILTAIADNNAEDTESPDLGPPPIAHFEVAEPISFDNTKSPKRVSGGIIDSEDEVLSLPSNLETRRKRRTSSLLHDMTKLDNEPETLTQEDNVKVSQESKPIGKRKFDASEMGVDRVSAPQHDGFEFSRRETGNLNRPRPSRFAARPADRVQDVHVEGPSISPQKALQTTRKILAPKSTNSPSKRITNSGGIQEKNVAPRDQGSPKSRLPARRISKASLSISSKVDHLELDHNEATIDPKTPAPPLEDIFSPPSSAIDASPAFKSTEVALTTSVEDVINGSIGRGSRRARAAVSYAEPNLRDKMRRPDKKLVGAVEGISKQASTSDQESTREKQRDKSIEPMSTARTIRIKSEKELDNDESWKNLPEAEHNSKDEAASPLKDKQNPNISKVAEPRRKRTFSEREGSKPDLTDTNDIDRAISRLSIFDPPLSSPISSSTDTTLTTTTRNGPTTKSRRHSVQPDQASTKTSTTHPTSSLSTQARSRMPNQDHSTGKENLNPVSTKLKRASSVQAFTQSQQNLSKSALPPSKGVAFESDSATATATAATGRSLGSRRRSMMI